MMMNVVLEDERVLKRKMYTSFDSLNEWHDMLGHIDSAAIKHLETGGLIDIADNTIASKIVTLCMS